MPRDHASPPRIDTAKLSLYVKDTTVGATGLLNPIERQFLAVLRNPTWSEYGRLTRYLDGRGLRYHYTVELGWLKDTQLAGQPFKPAFFNSDPETERTVPCESETKTDTSTRTSFETLELDESEEPIPAFRSNGKAK